MFRMQCCLKLINFLND
uniref:Uncharacterized protein n=1 Tax=Arundo donax TaxID=35708 RepID=A0A0A9HJN7_ARUDO